jgi:hypothetical protein
MGSENVRDVPAHGADPLTDNVVDYPDNVVLLHPAPKSDEQRVAEQKQFDKKLDAATQKYATIYP